MHRRLRLRPGRSKTQTTQTADCRLQTVQTVQTVQTESFFSYTSSRNYFRLTFFSSSYILLDISECLLFIISDRDVLALDGGCPGRSVLALENQNGGWVLRSTVLSYFGYALCKNGISPSVVHLQFYVNSSLHHSVTSEQFKTILNTYGIRCWA